MRLAAGLALIAFAGAAHAEPGGTAGVSRVAVTQGELKLEARTAVFDGGAIDGDWSHRAQASYGVTDWWRTQLNLRGAQPDGDDAELTSIGFENAFDFTATRDWPVRLGGQVEYRFGLDDADDSIEFKLLAQREIAGAATRLNLIAARPVGADSDEWSHGYAARAVWQINETFDLGAEAYGEFDNDAHAIGPRAGVSFGDAKLSAGYLFSTGDDTQADGQFRLALEWAP
jgi:hypothetical protein